MAARRVVFRRSSMIVSPALVALGVLLAATVAGCGVTTVTGVGPGNGGGLATPTSAAIGTPRPTATAAASASAGGGAAAGQPPAASGPHGTLAGAVMASPTCPIEQAENPCPPKPVADRQVAIETPSGAVAAKATTDAQGHFTVTLAPGTYTVKVAIVSGQVGMRQDTPANVTVVDGRTTSVTITLDTGIR